MDSPRSSESSENVRGTLRIDHIGLLVEDLDEAITLFARLGFGGARRARYETVRNAFIRCGEIDVELIELLDKTERAAKLDGAATRFAHLAIQVSDLDRTLQELHKNGVGTTGPVKALERYRSVLTAPETTGGLTCQLIEMHPPARPEPQ